MQLATHICAIKRTATHKRKPAVTRIFIHKHFAPYNCTHMFAKVMKVITERQEIRKDDAYENLLLISFAICSRKFDFCNKQIWR